jgi:proteasome beta subunit
VNWSPSPDADPSFLRLLQRSGMDPFARSTESLGGLEIQHGTTILALHYADGVLMAADRRATAGVMIANRRMQKLQQVDRWSGIAYAGAVGTALEMVRLFQFQVEHYEKIEGRTLTLDGKANQLSELVRANLGGINLGLVAIPLFGGYDVEERRGRIFGYEITGGRYEEQEFHADGSGSPYARTTLKMLWRDGLDEEQATDAAVRALWQAAEDDAATGGPDTVRRIYPTIATTTAAGFALMDDARVAERVQSLLADLGSAYSD